MRGSINSRETFLALTRSIMTISRLRGGAGSFSFPCFYRLFCTTINLQSIFSTHSFLTFVDVLFCGHSLDLENVFDIRISTKKKEFIENKKEQHCKSTQAKKDGMQGKINDSYLKCLYI